MTAINSPAATLLEDSWRLVFRLLYTPDELRRAILDERLTLRRSHKLVVLLLASRQLRNVVESEVVVLHVQCLRASPSAVLSVVGQNRSACRCVKVVRFDYNSLHCKFCAAFSKRCWLFSDLQSPQSLTMAVPIKDAWVALANPKIRWAVLQVQNAWLNRRRQRCAATALQRAWRGRLHDRSKKTEASATSVALSGFRRARARPSAGTEPCSKLLLRGIHSLDLSGPVPERGVDRARSAPTREAFPMEWIRHCPGLQVLSLRRTSLGDDHPLRLPRLRCVDVSHCRNLGDVGVARFFEEPCMLVTFRMQYCARVRQPDPFGCQTLELLDCLGCANLTDEAASSAVRASRLERLVLSECRRLQAPELGCPQLEDCSLALTRIGDAAVRSMLARSPSLRSLNLALCESLQRPIMAHAGLRRIVLRRCDSLDDRGVEDLVTGCRELEVADCRGCAALRAPALGGAVGSRAKRLRLDMRNCPALDLDALGSTQMLTEDSLELWF